MSLMTLYALSMMRSAARLKYTQITQIVSCIVEGVTA
jgi:hypothetical protein